MRNLLSQWETIKHNAGQNAAPCLIHRDLGLLERVLRMENTRKEIDEIVVDTEEDKVNIKVFHGCDSFPAKT